MVNSTVADFIAHSGIVHPLTGEEPSEAIAIRNGRIARLGTDEEILKMAGESTVAVDLAGRGVIPGINDSHLHASWLGLMWPASLMGGDTPFGTPPPPPLATDAQRRNAIHKAQQIAVSFGITSLTEPGLGPGEDGGATGAFGTSVVDIYKQLAADGELLTRVTVLSLFGLLDGNSAWEDFQQGLEVLENTSPNEDFLRFNGVKIFADGIPPMRSAYTDLCYTDHSRPELLIDGDDREEREEALRKMILLAHSRGHQIGVHATGDRSIQIMIDAVREAREDRDEDLRHYVIHGDLITSAQIAELAELGIGYNTQPGIPLRTAEMVDAALGEGAARRAWPLQEVLDAGVRLCLSSDAPVLGPDWREHIAAADAWMGETARPRARMEALLRAYTAAAAEQDGVDVAKGTLETGKAGDLCILAGDPFGVAPADLPGLDVEMTIVGGRVVYDRSLTPAADRHQPAR